FGVGLLDLHRHAHLLVREFDFIDAANFHAGHFHKVALLQLLHALEVRADFVAGLEEISHAHHLQNDHGHDQRKGKENAEPGFECVSHNPHVWQLSYSCELRFEVHDQKLLYDHIGNAH